MLNLLLLIIPLAFGIYLIGFWVKYCGQYRGRYFYYGIVAICCFMVFSASAWFSLFAK